MSDQIDDVNMKDLKSQKTRSDHFQFTPLQSILINKLMPRGFKLESEENLLKSMESMRPVLKKHKTGNFAGDETKKKKQRKMDFSEVTSKENSVFSEMNKKRSCREKKPIIYEDLGYVEKDKLKGAKNPILADICKKCERGFAKIKRHPFAEIFLNPTSPEAPSLSGIEKNLKNFTYTSTYQFGLDLRKLWSYYFATYTNNADIFQKTCKLSEFSEEVLKELENSQEEKSDLHELSRKVEKLTKEIKEISYKGGQPATSLSAKKGEKGGSGLDKPMTMAEKNSLGNSIRNLTAEQLKGIVNILSDSLVIDPQSKYFEFDIETLSTRKLRELEQYVKKCLKSKTPPAKTEPKLVKKSTPVAQNAELSENEKIAQLKNDLGVMKNEQSSNFNSSSNAATQLKRPLKREGEVKENKNAISESDDSLSSSEESDSESLSSLDFKKN